MAFDKIQTQAIDVDTAPVKGSVNNSDYVLIRDVTTGDLQRILVSDLLAGSAGSIRLHGEADMTASGTTQTKIVVTGDLNNAYIEQGKAPTDVSPNGIAYIVKAPQGGVQTQISGITETVNNDDEIVWTGSKWSILALGSDVTSVNGRTGDVTGLAEADNVYTKVESDSNYYRKSDVFTKSEAESRFYNVGEKVRKMESKDTRDENPTPIELGVKGLQADFKRNGVDGFTQGGEGYHGVLSYRSYGNNPNDFSGGPTHQLAFGSNGVIGHRSGSGNTWTDWETMYTSKFNKPTAADVGAIAVGDAYTKSETDTLLDKKLNESGGKLTGALEAATGGSYYTRLSSTNNAVGVYAYKNTSSVRAGGQGVLSRDGGDNVSLYIGWGESPWLERTSLTIAEDKIKYKGFRVYHEGDKPTASDVGALPASTKLFSGNYKDLQGIPTYFPTSWNDIDGKPNTFPSAPHNHNNLYYTKQEIDDKDYLTKAVADTEYAKISHNHDSLYYRKPEVDTKLNSKFDKSGGTIGNTVISSSHADAKLTLQRTDLDHHVEMAFLDGSGNITYFGTTKNGTLAYGDSANLSASGAEIYSTKNKPTASDVGALTQSQSDARYQAKNDKLARLISSEVDTNGGQDLKIRGKRALVGTTSNLVLNYAKDFSFVDVQSSMVSSGEIRAKGGINAESESKGGGLQYYGKTAIGGTNDGWLRLNPHSQFYSGIFCGKSLLRTDGEFTVGYWGGNKVTRMRQQFYDSTWGRNGTAAFSVNAKDSRGAHWAFASYYDGTNIRSGIQIMSDGGGRMRFYTNRRGNYVEVNGGNAFAGSRQSSASNAYTRKDYVDSKIAALPKARPSDVIVGNDGTDRTSGVRQGNVTWYARNWSGKTTQSSNLFTWVSPTTGFKVVNSGIYEIEATDARRTRSSGQDDQVSMRIQVNGATKTGNSCRGRDNDVINITSRWTGHLSAGQTVRFISSGGQIAVGGAHFKMRYIRP